jgi:hypothetical protein
LTILSFSVYLLHPASECIVGEMNPCDLLEAKKGSQGNFRLPGPTQIRSNCFPKASFCLPFFGDDEKILVFGVERWEVMGRFE